MRLLLWRTEAQFSAPLIGFLGLHRTRGTQLNAANLMFEILCHGRRSLPIVLSQRQNPGTPMNHDNQTAVAIAPVTNQVTEHLLSNIPDFVSMFLADSYTNLQGKYYERSPILHAHKVRTPTLLICGALDRCTPPAEAAQFHSALLENGVQSVLMTYPQEGHGIHKLPAAIDYAARVVTWFDRHISRNP
jgi:pimeloyl-ACP methyl ester carboxylesterase